MAASLRLATPLPRWNSNEVRTQSNQVEFKRFSISRTSRRAVSVTVSASNVPPTVSDTKLAFIKAYKRPIPSIYNNVVQELLVQQHLIRYNSSYSYNSIHALGFVTLYDQLMDGYPYGDQGAELIFKAYIQALNEDAEKYRSDAAAVEEWVKSSASVDALFDLTEKDGPIETELKSIANRAELQSKFQYSRFFAIGLFRILQLTNSTDPATLTKISEVLNLDKSSVDRDLDVYRGLLNKLTQARDLLKDFLEREKNKQAEREKEKA